MEMVALLIWFLPDNKTHTDTTGSDVPAVTRTSATLANITVMACKVYLTGLIR